MSHEYWLSKWHQNDIGFHVPTINIHFETYAKNILGAPFRKAKVLFPLCGKTVDMAEALRMGHQVIGIEFCEIAIKDFFAENKIEIRSIEKKSNQTIFHGESIEIHCGDIFTTDIGHNDIDLVFDRAALVALQENVRKKYVDLLAGTLKKTAQVLLVTLNYDRSVMDGPPYALSDQDIQTLYSDRFVIKELSRKEIIDELEHLRKKGLFSLIETAYLLNKKAV